ncbi:hypothetical protein P280DRAFT_47519 [Massarina eburnea CBS 473.64]|uniref:DUF7730 domain-containing protein n=1 Tax=Massarina eburnea CBS 473.64 TaxID=1395130 RepID=A0A6A6RXN1_9PLEO|nr:hypothetical protein P280DRAFT_47519 [Massarina eburnea CBS 473.64]
MPGSRERRTKRVKQLCARAVFISATVFTAPFYWRQYYQKTSRYRMKEQKKRDLERAQRLAPPPIREREYALSISSTLNVEPTISSQRAEEEEPSLFFRLPYELRLAIYEDVIGPHNLHIIWKDGMLHSFRCYAHPSKPRTHTLDLTDGLYRDFDQKRLTYLEQGHCWRDERYYRYLTLIPGSGIGVLPLLQTCRSM